MSEQQFLAPVSDRFIAGDLLEVDVFMSNLPNDKIYGVYLVGSETVNLQELEDSLDSRKFLQKRVIFFNQALKLKPTKIPAAFGKIRYSLELPSTLPSSLLYADRGMSAEILYTMEISAEGEILAFQKISISQPVSSPRPLHAELSLLKRGLFCSDHPDAELVLEAETDIYKIRDSVTLNLIYRSSELFPPAVTVLAVVWEIADGFKQQRWRRLSEDHLRTRRPGKYRLHLAWSGLDTTEGTAGQNCKLSHVLSVALMASSGARSAVVKLPIRLTSVDLPAEDAL
jgi:hypothetical protein